MGGVWVCERNRLTSVGDASHVHTGKRIRPHPDEREDVFQPAGADVGGLQEDGGQAAAVCAAHGSVTSSAAAAVAAATTDAGPAAAAVPGPPSRLQAEPARTVGLLSARPCACAAYMLSARTCASAAVADASNQRTAFVR